MSRKSGREQVDESTDEAFDFSLPSFDDDDGDSSGDDFLPSLPGLDDDDMDFSIPSLDLSIDDDLSTSGTSSEPQKSVKIEVSLNRIRKYIMERQEIDGGWDGDARTTAECLRVITHDESVESDGVKLAINFLLALQKKNGSWNDDFIVTAAVIKALRSVKKNLVII